MPSRTSESHKGDFGRVLVIGGSDDPLCPAEEFWGWVEHAIEPEVAIVDGGHFLASRSAPAVAEAMTRFITRLGTTVSGEIPIVSEIRDLESADESNVRRIA